jgi:hypothetical protein
MASSYIQAIRQRRRARVLIMSILAVLAPIIGVILVLGLWGFVDLLVVS